MGNEGEGKTVKKDSKDGRSRTAGEGEDRKEEKGERGKKDKESREKRGRKTYVNKTGRMKGNSAEKKNGTYRRR